MTSSLFSSVTGLSLWGAIVSVGIVVTFYTSLVSLETSKRSICTISTNLLDVTCNNSNVHVAEFFREDCGLWCGRTRFRRSLLWGASLGLL